MIKMKNFLLYVATVVIGLVIGWGIYAIIVIVFRSFRSLGGY